MPNEISLDESMPSRMGAYRIYMYVRDLEALNRGYKVKIKTLEGELDEAKRQVVSADAAADAASRMLCNGEADEQQA
jgi:hypothetical protein